MLQQTKQHNIKAHVRWLVAKIKGKLEEENYPKK